MEQTSLQFNPHKGQGKGPELQLSPCRGRRDPQRLFPDLFPGHPTTELAFTTHILALEGGKVLQSPLVHAGP